MNALEIVFGIVLMLFAIAIIIVVLLQEGSQKNLQTGSISLQIRLESMVRQN